jgi:SAM-dependent methyltransferase
MPPSDPSVGPTTTTTRQVESSQYHQAYEWRRQRSTMTEIARNWLCEQAPRWAHLRAHTGPLRILSVGCGDGSSDLAMLQALEPHTPVEYVGIDVNPVSLATFRSQAGDLPVTLADTPLELLELDGEPFDIVLLSHMLYYVDQPGAHVSRLLRRFTRTDGRVIIVHSAHEGIPALMQAVDGLTPFLTAQDIANELEAEGLPPTWHVLHTELDATDLLANTPEGRAVLEFCVETPLDDLTPETRLQLHSELSRRCSESSGRWMMAEEVGVLELRNPLRELLPMGLTTPTVDPLMDYHQLAETFAWPERLRSLPLCSDGHAHLLDIGCGTGRWLRVLNATYPELAQGSAPLLRYSMLDPVQPAIDTVGDVASTMFTVDRSWCDFVQNAQLPARHFGLIWSVHSLYGVPAHDLPDALKHMLAALHPEGTAIIVLPDRHSFYVEAAVQLLGHTVFTSADDVRAALDAMGQSYQVRHVRYHEHIPANDKAALSHYVWVESIGNTYLPGGAHDEMHDLPSGPWWESLRRGDVFAFPQNVEVILIPGGQ